MAYTERSYIGAGKLYLGGLFIGNVPSLQLGFESEEITLIDKTQGGGGVYNGAFRISNVSFEFAFNDYNARNLEFALYGESSKVTAVAISAESFTVPADFADDDILIPFADGNIGDTSVAPTITGKILGTDFDIATGGIIIYAAGAFTANDTDDIDYTRRGADLVQALVNSGQEYEMLFDGLNDAQSGDAVVASIYRGKPSPASGLPLISDDHAENTVNGSILADQNKTGAGISKYFTIALQDAT